MGEHLRDWKITFFQKSAEPDSLITVTQQREEHRTPALDVSASKGSEKRVASSHTSSFMSLNQVDFTYLR